MAFSLISFLGVVIFRYFSLAEADEMSSRDSRNELYCAIAKSVFCIPIFENRQCAKLSHCLHHQGDHHNAESAIAEHTRTADHISIFSRKGVILLHEKFSTNNVVVTFCGHVVSG